MYMISYLGKVNYSANITQIIDYYQVTNHCMEVKSMVWYLHFSFSYGIGQVINGIFAKKYNIKWMIFAVLLFQLL